MPLTEREQELMRLLRVYLNHLAGGLKADPRGVEPFGPIDAAVQRWLQLAIQCCLDLGDSILSRVGEAEPPRLRDIFPALARRGIIPAELARAMEQLAGYRNTLGHAYATITPAQTWRVGGGGLPQLQEFAERVGAWAARPREDSG